MLTDNDKAYIEARIDALNVRGTEFATIIGTEIASAIGAEREYEATPAGVERALNKKLTVEVFKLGAALTQLISAADSGEWHSSTDCKVERRACELCQALTRARKVMKP